MNDRTHEGPDGPAFNAWLRNNDPENIAFKQEAARTIAHLDEVLAEPVRVQTTLETALVKAMEYEVEKAKQAAAYWQAEAQRLYVEAKNRIAADLAAAARKRSRRRKALEALRWVGIMVAAWAFGLAWAYWSR